MRGEWLSLLGLYRYDPSILDELVLPDAVDRSDLIDNLLVETAELEIIYPEPEIMRQIIGSWSRARLAVWNRVALIVSVFASFMRFRHLLAAVFLSQGSTLFLSLMES